MTYYNLYLFTRNSMTNIKSLIPLMFILLVLKSLGNPDQDLVKDFPFSYQHAWYSGYLNFSSGDFHYVFFESEGNPDTDPLLIWLNGGPGCSSMLGMLYQNGPFVFHPNTSELHLNEYAWNKQANLLYIQSPGQVGFSKGSRQIYNDNNTAEDNFAALQAFYKKFPNMKKNDLFITGESYSGIYVPYFAYQIMKYNSLPESEDKKINLRGIMVGNACTHPKQCYDATAQGNSMYQYQFLYNHGFYTEQQYSDLISKCSLNFHSQQCQFVRDYFDKQFAETQSDILNIYGPCYRQQSSYKIRNQRIHKSQYTSDTDCADFIGILSILNDEAVKKSLHVENIQFQPCSDQIADTYVSNAQASYWLYPHFLSKGIRVWVYSGDVDADVPITGTLQWIKMLKEQMGLPTIEKWRKWWISGQHKSEKQVGGMYWQLDGLTFISVRGAGHMVPQTKPASASYLIHGFLTGNALD